MKQVLILLSLFLGRILKRFPVYIVADFNFFLTVVFTFHAGYTSVWGCKFFYMLIFSVRLLVLN